ncbi:MAG: hypothetical protein E7294_09895 [Lachnospiraceae bacterium]|nr:hypothetical protein [Lachnospiraceae bacterium]
MSENRHVWGYWKCPSCATIIRGDNRVCPQCGTPIPNNVRYMPPDDPQVREAIGNGKAVDSYVEYVDKEKESDQANWNCEYCGYQNPYDALTCQGCCAPRYESEQDYFGNAMNHTEEDKKEREIHGLPNNRPAPPPVRPQVGQNNRQTDAKQKRFTGIAIAAVVILFLIWLFTPVTRSSVIQSFRWERNVEVEEYTLCHEDDWTLPEGATLTDTKQEIHHYNQVLDHYETKTRQVSHQEQDGYDTEYRDLGNGQYETVQTPRYKTVWETETYEEPVYKDVPEYRTKYYYDIGRWKKVDDLPTSGNDQNPVWHECEYPEDVSSPDYGDKRQGPKQETYFVIIKDKKGKEQEVEYPYSEWTALSAGDKISYKTHRFSNKPLN